MPSERLPQAPLEQPQQEPSQPQVKVCSSCHNPLLDSTSTLFFLHEADAIVCGLCRDHVWSARGALNPPPPPSGRALCDEVDAEFNRRQETQVLSSTQISSTRQQNGSISHSVDDDIEMTSPAAITEPDGSSPHPLIPALPTFHPKPSLHPIIVENLAVASQQPLTLRCQAQIQSAVVAVPDAKVNPSRNKHPTASSLDPLVDITRLRVRSQGRHCLYPGATFQGTQKSGRNSYDVNVTIVDVDFSASTLCGYLQIRGLTDDWPELTTYFDAEIVGSRYGFLTRNWGANEQEDIIHWSRFPAFRNVKNELKKPHLTMSDRDRGAVFMRWKERFLVPDHRVQDISGASFAGFYYVCVDFNPPSAQTAMRNCPLASSSPDVYSRVISPTRTEPESCPRRNSSAYRSSFVPRSSHVATMSGFYFHQNSEPYQQLSLTHIPERTSSSFEFR